MSITSEPSTAENHPELVHRRPPKQVGGCKPIAPIERDFDTLLMFMADNQESKSVRHPEMMQHREHDSSFTQRRRFLLPRRRRLEHGQVIGVTNQLGEPLEDRPIHVQQVFATIYHQLSLDVRQALLKAPNGRPQYLVDHREPIRELI